MPAPLGFANVAFAGRLRKKPAMAIDLVSIGICPLVTKEDRDFAHEWIRNAILRGSYRFFEGDKDFPKHLWYCADGKGWFGLCINSASGSYKGWPMDEDEYLAYCS